ncbi:MAG: hypothetical protein AAB414_05220 [Patescibacteria group bacterium]
MNNILAIILKDTFTELQLKHRLKVLKSHLLKALFGGKEQFLSREDLNWLSSVSQTLQTFHKDNVYQILEELESQSSQLPLLTIYLPVASTDNICLQIASMARKTFQNPKIILSAKYDPNLIAGCALVWKGVYRDYSLRVKIEEKKEELLGNFKKFLK